MGLLTLHSLSLELAFWFGAPNWVLKKVHGLFKLTNTQVLVSGFTSSMAPVRKKSVKKRFLGEILPVKEVKNSTVTRNHKFSKLGPLWTTNELHRFYKAYRLHGKSWKKVAAQVRNRSVEMVEALYNLNRAYLSLPEGTATVRGLVAMMTDHYSAREEVETEGDSDGGSPELVQRPKKQKLDRIELSTSKADPNHFHPLESTDGCLSLLKKPIAFGDLPRVVGKRTPRVRVSLLHNEDDDMNSAPDQQSDIDGHVAALTLIEASNRRYSPQLLPREESSNQGFGSKDVNGDVNAYPRTTKSWCGFKGVDSVGSFHMDKRFYGREVRAQQSGTKLSDNEREACRGTEAKICTGSAATEVLSSKSDKCSPDEFPDLDGLLMLADLSVRELESNCKLIEERAFVDRNDKSDIPEDTPSGHEKEAPVEDELLSSFKSVQGCYTKKHKSGRNSANFKPPPEAMQPIQSNDLNSSEIKIKDVTSELKWSNPEPLMSSRQSKSLETEVSNEDETKSSANIERSDLPRQVKPTLAMNGALTAELMKASFCIDGSTETSFFSNQSILSTGKRSRIKADMKRASMQKEGRSSKKNRKVESDKQLNPLNDRELHQEDKLFCCLSSPMFRRWCSYEWFYNAIDYPWFANKEFAEYLNHVGLGQIRRLTRAEWGVIRSSLGKPRRFSHHFLQEEREKLKQYRDSVRTHYSELHSGARDELPRDLPKPLLVGQRVTAFHPKIRELHDGSVLAVECGRCMLQFSCPQLGVEFVEDIDCMPLNPMDNMPEALRTQRLKVREHSNSSLASSWQQENGPSPLETTVNQPQVDKLHVVPQTTAAAADVTTQHRSFQNLPELTCSFDAQASSSVPTSSRQYNFDPEFNSHPSLKPASSSIYARGTPSSISSFHCQESESMANDVLRTSRSKAAIMVDTAVHAFFCGGGGGDKKEDPYLRTRKALDSVDISTSQAEDDDDDDVKGSTYDPSSSSSSEPPPKVNVDHLHGLEFDNGSGIEAMIPTELITSCVTAFVTIKSCSEKRYPPADMAEAIESALAWLHPRCPQNLNLYRDIQTRMRMIKTQILSLLPT